MVAKVAAGADTDAYCGKCKLVLAHVVIAMRGAKPARVECKTCRDVHAFRMSAPAAKKTSTRRKAGQSAIQKQYHELMEGRDISQAVRYKTSIRLAEGDMIDHKVFGIGMVTRLLSDDKVEIAFQNEAKILVHAR